MAKAGEEEVRERARANEISFGKREIEGEEEERSSCPCVGFFSEYKNLVLLGRGGMMSCKLPTKLMFLVYGLLSSPPSVSKRLLK